MKNIPKKEKTILILPPIIITLKRKYIKNPQKERP
jgi:hypothetical protein